MASIPDLIPYTGATVNAPALLTPSIPLRNGTIEKLRVKLPDGVTDGDAIFRFYINGVEKAADLTIADTGSEIDVTGLSYATTEDDKGEFRIIAPMPTALPVSPINFYIYYVETHVDLTTAQTIAGNKTFTGATDFGGATSLELPNSAAPTVNADGEIAVDTTVADFSHGIPKVYAGEELGIVVMPVAEFTSPTNGHVVAYNATNDEFELVAQTGGGGSTAADISIDEIGTATYDTVADHLKIITSPGWISGGTITDSGSAEIDVAAGTGFIRATDGDTDTLYSFDWAGVTNQAITADSIRYVGVQYNAGSPQVFIKTTDAFDYDTEFPLGVVVNEGGTLYIANRPWKTADALADVMERFDSTALVTRDNRTGGLILGNTGTRNVTVSAGALLSRLSEYSVAAIDTSASSTFDAYYRNGSGGWTKQAAQTQWNNSNYDDGDGTLGSLTSNRYTSRWFYLTLSGALVMVYGQAEYQSLANALNEGAPSTVPNRLTAAGILIGRIIAQQGSNTPGAVQTAFTTSFSAASVTDFSQLSGTVSSSQIADESVTYAKMQNVSAASKLLGRGDSGSGDVQEITLGTGLSMSGTTLNSSGGSSVSGGSFDIDCGDAAGTGDFVINCGDAT